MLSPMPFIGSGRADRDHRRRARRHPTLPEVAEHRELDLIVVASPRRSCQAGKPGQLLEALDLAQAEIKKICEAQVDLQRQAGRRSGSIRVSRRRSRSSATRSASGSVPKAWASDAVIEEALGQLSMDSTEEDVLRQVQRR
jgi:hypothetical protein